MTRFLLLCVLCVSAVMTSSAAADQTWSLTTADFRRQTVSLQSLDESGAKITPFGGGNQPIIIPLDKLLQLDRGATATQQVRGAWTLILTTGDRIGGDPLSIANDALIVKSPAAGQLTVPLKTIRDLYKGHDIPPKPAATEQNRTEDIILLANGDTVRGIVTALANNKITVKTPAGDELPVEMAAIKSIHLASAGTPNTAGRRAFRVQLSDGSVITAPKVTIDGSVNQVQLTLDDGAKRTLDVSSITLIEQLNGPVAWLSALPPDQVAYQPMFDVSFPPQTDRNYKGDRIRFSGKEYNRGIGVHAWCRMTWNLEGKNYKAFRTQYALADDAQRGRVTVRILVDDKLVHQSKDFAPAKLSPVILLDIAGAKTLTLEAHPGGDPNSQDPTQWNIDTQARLNWIESALLKEKPAPEPPPTPAPAPRPSTKPTTTKPATRPPQ